MFLRLASGDGLIAADIAPLQTDGREIEMVKNFTYLQWYLLMLRSWKISGVGWLKLREFLAV